MREVVGSNAALWSSTSNQYIESRSKGRTYLIHQHAQIDQYSPKQTSDCEDVEDRLSCPASKIHQLPNIL
jgi:hypothetical protein